MTADDELMSGDEGGGRDVMARLTEGLMAPAVRLSFRTRVCLSVSVCLAVRRAVLQFLF